MELNVGAFMKTNSKKKLICILSMSCVLTLSGCITMDGMSKNIQALTSPAMTKDTPSQICQMAKDNQVRASDTYAKSGFSATGKVTSINDRALPPRYSVLIDISNKITVAASTDSLNSVKDLTIGNPVKVAGTIASISNTGDKYLGCMIHLRNSSFQN